MNSKIFKIIVIFLLSSLFGLFSQTDFVTVYSDFDQELLGRSVQRSSRESVHMEMFKLAETLEVPKSDNRQSGKTLLVLSSDIKQELDHLLTDEGFVIKNGIELSWTLFHGIPVYRYFDDRAGLDIQFSLQKPDDYVLEQVHQVYRDPYWRDVVLGEYNSSFVITIHMAEDLGRTGLDYQDILYSATLLGDYHQPLWGIHDGNGLLEQFVQLETIETADLPGYLEYRPILENRFRLLNLLGRIDRIEGSFPENLQRTLKSLFFFHSDLNLGHFVQLPEEVILRKEGSLWDLNVFYYDFLMRKGYQVIVLITEDSSPDQFSEPLILFRESIMDLWSVMESDSLTYDVGKDWREIPGYLAGRNIRYHRVDMSRLVQNRALPMVQDLVWTWSRY